MIVPRTREQLWISTTKKISISLCGKFGKLIPVESRVTISTSKSPTFAACGAPVSQYESNLKGDTSSFTRYLAVLWHRMEGIAAFLGRDFITFASSTFNADVAVDGCLWPEVLKN